MIEHYRRRLNELVGTLSVSTNVIDLPETFQKKLNGTLTKSGVGETLESRNPAELFR